MEFMNPALQTGSAIAVNDYKDLRQIPTAILSAAAALPNDVTWLESTQLPLKHYVGLGVRFFPIASLGSGETSDPPFQSWREISALEIFPPTDVMRDDYVLLQKRRWIRLMVITAPDDDRTACVRFYFLPHDMLQTVVPRDEPRLSRAFMSLLLSLITCSKAWNGFAASSRGDSQSILPRAPATPHSLFYAFNNLESPKVDPDMISDRPSQHAVETVLYGDSQSIGLITNLYPYQRQSVAKMIQKEASTERFVDPSLQKIDSCDGHELYIDFNGERLLKEKQEFEYVKGGILAEEMGLGKTLICLSVILATKDHWPRIDSQFAESGPQTNPRVNSLFDMCVSAAVRRGIPWQERRHDPEFPQVAIQALEKKRLSYVIPAPRPTSRTKLKTLSLGRRLVMSTATIVVVPSNLLDQWKFEIKKHVVDGALKVLTLGKASDQVPTEKELLSYDVLLFSMDRFKKELEQMRSIDPVCTCKKPHYDIEYEHEPICQTLTRYTMFSSPLLSIHWKRLIVDEGHVLASSQLKTQAVEVAERLTVERRWIVSGTPTSGLYGVTIALAANETNAFDTDLDKKLQAEMELETRKEFSKTDSRDFDDISTMITDFFRMEPWASDIGSFMSGRRRKSGKGSGLSRSSAPMEVLLSLFVRHRIEEVEYHVKLPPLHNTVVTLEPCYYDKLAYNIFISHLLSNSILSEREGEDWMFHKSSRNSLRELIRNLRSSSLYWMHKETTIQDTLKHSREYQEKKSEIMSDGDRQNLQSVIDTLENVLLDSTYMAMAKGDEVAVVVERLPPDIQSPLCIHIDSQGQHYMSLTQARMAQEHVRLALRKNADLHPLSQLGNAAIMHQMAVEAEKQAEKVRLEDQQQQLDSPTSPKKRKLTVRRSTSAAAKLSKATSKNIKLEDEKISHPYSSDLAKTRIVGVASRKMIYLMERVLELQKTDKIIIFFEEDSAAYYIKQSLEVFNVKHLVYAKSLSVKLRSEVAVAFNTGNEHRVLLIDVRQASHGLNLSSATRIFFICPVWQPNIEAQAIKRAHRIGQTRPVYVETLVLQDTLEQRLMQRRNNMSSEEHSKADKDLLEDTTMERIIQDARLFPLSEREIRNPKERVAVLQQPLLLWDAFLTDDYKRFYTNHGSIAENAPSAKHTAIPVRGLTENSTELRAVPKAEKPVKKARVQWDL
jgi:SNF2 family DNA or RNA helicase